MVGGMVMPAPCLGPQNEAAAEKSWHQALPLPSTGTSTDGVEHPLLEPLLQWGCRKTGEVRAEVCHHGPGSGAQIECEGGGGKGAYFAK